MGARSLSAVVAALLLLAAPARADEGGPVALDARADEVVDAEALRVHLAVEARRDVARASDAATSSVRVVVERASPTSVRARIERGGVADAPRLVDLADLPREHRARVVALVLAEALREPPVAPPAEAPAQPSPASAPSPPAPAPSRPSEAPPPAAPATGSGPEIAVSALGGARAYPSRNMLLGELRLGLDLGLRQLPFVAVHVDGGGAFGGRDDELGSVGVSLLGVSAGPVGRFALGPVELAAGPVFAVDRGRATAVPVLGADAAEVSGTLTTLELRVGARVPLGAHAFVGLGARAGHVLSALDFAAESATGARRVAGFGGASGALQLELGLR